MSNSTTTAIKKYPFSRDSGDRWLRQMPEHWKVIRLRNILKSKAERYRPDLPLLSVVREKGVILRDSEDSEENHNVIPEDLSNYKVVREGQFAMNKMKAWQGSYGVSPYEGIVSPAYFTFSVTGIDGNFLHSALRSQDYVRFFTQASDGVRIGQWDLSPARMREIPVLVPPLEEQGLHRPVPRRRRTAYPGLRERQGEAHRPAGGGATVRHPPGRYKGPGPGCES